ncbi:TPA: hypothetical protein KNG91_003004 [Serratia fonticola]|uniref:hypothetical protein n=1 Tax=Serratia fonticola TaxID=47917 RepID=UPI003AAC7047|nr:hypothetical protein [Serratia fonticola]
MKDRTRSYTTDLPRIGLPFLANMRRDLTNASDGHAIYTTTESGTLWITKNGNGYTATINGHSFRLSLTTTQAGYGMRHWYLCPHCHQRCAKLHIGRKDIACRKCCGLHYASQSEDRITRMRRLIRSKRLAIWGYDTPDLMNLVKTPFQFAKPKGMRWETFERKRWQLFRLEERYWKVFIPIIERLTGKIERT